MWIEFSEFNLKILILLIYPVSKRIQDYSKKAYLVKDHQLFKTFRYFASYIFAFIPLLIPVTPLIIVDKPPVKYVPAEKAATVEIVFFKNLLKL